MEKYPDRLFICEDSHDETSGIGLCMRKAQLWFKRLTYIDVIFFVDCVFFFFFFFVNVSLLFY